jgi:hypothetical protein
LRVDVRKRISFRNVRIRPLGLYYPSRGLRVEARIDTGEPRHFARPVDSKLRGCDLVALKVEEVAPNGYAIDRATVRQKKTGRPVKFELTDQTRQAVDDYLRAAGKKLGGHASVVSSSRRSTCRAGSRHRRAISCKPSLASESGALGLLLCLCGMLPVVFGFCHA